MNRRRRHIGKECLLPCGSLSACSYFSEKPDWVGVRVAMENGLQKVSPFTGQASEGQGRQSQEPTSRLGNIASSGRVFKKSRMLKRGAKGVIRRRHMTTVAGTKECGLARTTTGRDYMAILVGPIRPENPSRLRLRAPSIPVQSLLLCSHPHHQQHRPDEHSDCDARIQHALNQCSSHHDVFPFKKQ